MDLVVARKWHRCTPVTVSRQRLCPSPPTTRMTNARFSFKTLHQPKRRCPVCSRRFTGRSDKIFCSVQCKNDFHSDRRSEARFIRRELHRGLWRNRNILRYFMSLGERPCQVPEEALERVGFRWQLMTGRTTHGSSAVRYHIYDLMWTRRTDGRIEIGWSSLWPKTPVTQRSTR